jgi:hypothetical protein
VKRIILTCICLTVVVSGCAYVPYAREAKKKPHEGGVISLKTDHRPEDDQKAQAMMAANCGSNASVKVLEEGEVVVGERSNTNANKTNQMQDSGGFSLGNGFKLGGGSRPSENTNTVSETTQLKEWQIAYTCEPYKKSK